MSVKYLLILLFFLSACSCEQKEIIASYKELGGCWISEDEIYNMKVSITFSDTSIEFDPAVGDSVVCFNQPILDKDTLRCVINETTYKFHIMKEEEDFIISGLPFIKGEMKFKKCRH